MVFKEKARGGGGKLFQLGWELLVSPVLVENEKPKLTTEDKIHQEDVLRWALGQDSLKVARRRDQLTHDVTYGPERG